MWRGNLELPPKVFCLLSAPPLSHDAFHKKMWTEQNYTSGGVPCKCPSKYNPHTINLKLNTSSTGILRRLFEGAGDPALRCPVGGITEQSNHTSVQKALGQQQPLISQSSHPKDVVRGIPLNQFILVCRICSEDIEKEAALSCQWFRQQEYPKWVLEQAYGIAKAKNRQDLL